MNANRFGLVVATGVLAIVGLGACGSDATGGVASAAGTTASTSGDTVEIPETLSVDGQALAMIGFDPAQLKTEADEPGSPTPSVAATSNTSTKGANSRAGNRRRALRRIALRRHVQHGEFVIQTKQGEKTVDVQHGTVQAVNATSITVKCADGFTETWTLDNTLRVVQNRAKSTPSAITVGAEIGVAGVKNGTTLLAKLVGLPAK